MQLEFVLCVALRKGKAGSRNGVTLQASVALIEQYVLSMLWGPVDWELRNRSPLVLGISIPNCAGERLPNRSQRVLAGKPLRLEVRLCDTTQHR